MRKKLLSIVLTLCLVFSLLPATALATSTIWDGTTDTTWYNESDTSFTLTTAEQLAGLAELVNGGKDFYGKTVSLGEDIVLNDSLSEDSRQWTPIGDAAAAKGFAGTFDGCGHTVSGLYINNNANNQALFGYISAREGSTGGTVRNLGVVDSAVTCASQSGGVVGYSNAGLVANCYADVTVHTSGNYAGGIVGSANSTITVENCYNVGTVTADGSYVGGIAPCPTIGHVLQSYGLESAVPSATGDSGSLSNSRGYLIGWTMSATVTGDHFSGADGTLSGGGTLVEKLNSWVEEQNNSDYYTWQIAAGVNGGYPVQNAPLSVEQYSVTVTTQKDGAVWNSGRTFSLKSVTSSRVVTNLNAVQPDTYHVLDGGGDTGATLTVTNENASVTLNYYTISGTVSDYVGGGHTVSGLTVRLYTQADTSFQAPLSMAITGNDGSYSIVWTPGSYVARVAGVQNTYGAGSANVILDSDAVTDANIILSEITTERILITSTNHKTAYQIGDTLDVTNLQISAYMSDGTTKTIAGTDSTVRVTGFNSSSVNPNQTLTVTYDGKTTTYVISISQAAYNGTQAGVPTVKLKTETSVTLTAQSMAGETVEYAKSESPAVPTSGWQDSTNFTGLSGGVYYYFFARVKETAVHGAGTAASAKIQTLRSAVDRLYLDISNGNIVIDPADGGIKVTCGWSSQIYSSGTEIVITGSSGNRTITANTSCFITFSGVTITPAANSKANAMNITAGTVTLTLADDTVNTLKPQGETATGANNNQGKAALRVFPSASLIINGSTGKLIATGGNAQAYSDSASWGGSGAGIGGNAGCCFDTAGIYATPGEDSGSVTINGGVIIATGGCVSSYWGGSGSGIGGGGDAYHSRKNGASGAVTINGGFVTAVGGAKDGGSNQGSGIGGAISPDASAGTTVMVAITNGTVIAAGGIGNGADASTGILTITGGSLKASTIGGATPTNGTSPVYKATFIVPAVTADGTKVTGLTSANYGTKDIYTVDTNKVYLYLPEGNATANYNGGSSSTNVTTDGTAVFPVSETFTATASMSGYTYGGTVSTPAVSQNPGSGAVTYYYTNENKNSGGTEWKSISDATLSAGDYYMYAVIAASGSYAACTTDAVKFTVSKATWSTPAAPTVSGTNTSGSITVTSVSGQMYFCQLAGSNAPTSAVPGWTQAAGTTLTFSSLSPNQSYDVFTYIPKDTNHNNSGVSPKLNTTTASAKVTAVTAPGDVILTKYYTIGSSVIPGLPGAAKATLEEGGTQYLNITWIAPGTYNAAPSAANTYIWNVSAPTNYAFADGVTHSGSITVTNKAATPVAITATKDEKILTRSYAGSTIDVTNLFSIDKKAGAAAYSVMPGTGTGSITTAGVLTVTKAGTFTVQVDTAATGNYASGSATAELTISNGTGSGTVTIADWVYGSTAKTPAPASTTNGTGSVTYSYEGVSGTSYTASATPPTAAGSYKLTATFAATDLYNECSATDTFSIAKAPVSFAVSGNMHDYDAAAHTATVTQTASETPSVGGCFTVAYQKDTELAKANEINVGAYKIIVTLTDNNFKFEGKDDAVRSLTLTDKLTISAVAYPDAGSITLPTAGSLTYGAKLSDSALTDGDTKCTYAWKTGTTIPTVTNTGYAVVCTPEDTNYAPFEKTVPIAVSKAAPTLTLPTANAITYGQKLSDSTFTGGSAGATYNGAANTDVPGAYSWSAGTSAPQVSDSNSTQYEVTFTPTDTANYSTATGKITLTVIPKPVTLTWDYTTPFTYDGASKTVAAIVSNKIGEDTFTLAYSDNSKTNAGSYTAKVTALGNSNYTLTDGEYIAKEWVIQKAFISFAVSDNNYTYDAAAHKATVAQTANETTKIDASKFAVTYKLPANDSATASKTKVGAYDIIVTLSDDNFCFAGESDAASRSHKVGTMTVQRNTVTALWKNTTTVYDGTAQSPEFELVGLKAADTGVTARLTESKTNADTYAVTAELTGANSGNYTLTNPNGTFIIQKVPVSFTLSGNSVKKGESVHVTAAPSVSGISAALTYWRSGKQVTSPTDVGSYDIYAAFSDPNYRHAGGTDGAAQKIGVLTIYDSSLPATYTVTFDANGGTGSTASMAAVQAGTVRILPESGFISTGKTFVGWQYGSKTYQPGECFTQPSSNVSLKALWNDKVYSIGGVVQEGDPADAADHVVVTLMLGSRQIGQTVTGADGKYRFTEVVPSIYNLVANKNGVTQTVLVTVEDKVVADQTITMPVGKLNSVVEVKAGSPAIVVGDLEKAFTQQDKTDAASKTVELKLTVQAKAADSTNDAQQEIKKKAGSIDLFLDFALTKTVDGTPSPLDSSPVLLTAVITLPAELQGKDSYTVYRYHGTEVQTLTTTANVEGEKIEVSKDKTTLTVYTKNFSAYAIKGVTHSSGGGSGVPSYKLTFEVNGGIAITGLSKTSGTTVDLSAYTPVREGYIFAGWYSDAKLTKAVTSVKLTANTTVYAKWTEKGAMPFTDVPADSYYYDAVLWALDKGITGGTTATTFNPNGICTRAQTVTFLWRAMGSPEPTATSCPFTDVIKDTYYDKAVLWATEKGITAGTSSTTFSPDAIVTRGQTVTFLWRTAHKPTVTSANQFGDVESDAYYAKAVLWAVSEGITSGTGASIFSPADGCTRAQIVTFLYRYLSK